MKRFEFGEGAELGWIVFRLFFAGALLLEVPTSHLKNIHAHSGELFHLPYVAWLPTIPPLLYDWLHWLQYPLILMLGFGVRARTSAAVLLTMQSWIFFSDALNFRNHPYFFLLLLAAIVLQPNGGSWVGRRASDWSERRIPWCWPRMIQILLSLCYLLAGLHKLHPTYLSGAVIADLRPETPAIAAWAVVALELSLAFGLWIPRVRPAAIAIGLLFHFSLAMLLDVHAFSLAIIAIYVLFAVDTSPAADKGVR